MTPLESSFEFSDSLNCENIIEHVLVWARKLHESVLYQAFFCFFFELVKNEEGPKFSFLFSLNLTRKREGNFIHMFFTSWKQVSYS